MTDDSSLQFVDTNILVYAHDRSAGEKYHQARAAIQSLWDSGLGCLSVQVLQEFYVTLTRKVMRPVSPDEARRLVADLSTWRVHSPDAEDVLGAIDLQQRYQLSFWDAMILLSAIRAGAQTVLSEDLNPGQDYDGVRVIDPLLG